MDDSIAQDHALALWAIAEKITVLRNVQDSRKEGAAALASVAEACWWIASLDEQLARAHGREYTTSRDNDSQGRPVFGIRWARHRHSHNLITTSAGDVRPFISDEPGSVFFISNPYRWRTVASMKLDGESAALAPTQRDRYIESMEGRKVIPILSGALEWLTETVAQKTPSK